jgi:hypothetical protein
MANAAGSFNVDVSDVPGNARGGGVQFNADGAQQLSFTDALRSGESSFQVSTSSSSNSEGDNSGEPASVASSTSSDASSSTSASSAVLSALSTVLISTTDTVAATSSSSSAPAAGGSGAGAGSNGSETRRKGGANQTDDEDLTPEEQLSLLSELSAKLEPYLRSSLLLLSRFSGILKALGMQPKFPVVLPWQAFLNFMIRPEPEADKADKGGGNDAKLPEKDIAPVMSMLEPPAALQNLGVVRGIRWEELIDQLAAAQVKDEANAPSYGYLAASVLACGVFQSDVRVPSRRARAAEKPRSNRRFPIPPRI